MLIGVRGHDVMGKTEAKTLAEKMRQDGFDTVQLVPYKSLVGVSDKYGCMTPALAFTAARAFREAGIHIALVGSYFNLLENNKVLFDDAKKRFKEYLKFAKDFDCFIVGTETGSYNSDWSYHPDNHKEMVFDQVVEIFRELVGAAEKHGVCVGIEGAWHHVVYSPQKLRELLRRVDSENLQVVFDPVNFFNPDAEGDRTAVMRQLIEESLEFFGDRIAVVHAKDFVINSSGEKVQVVLGEGLIDYAHFISAIRKYKPKIDMIIEGMEGKNLEKSKKFLQTYF